MSLYVANTSLQSITIHARTLSGNASQPVHLESGQSQELGQDWPAFHHALVIADLRKHGARTPDEADRTALDFSGILYREGAPITRDEIQRSRILSASHLPRIKTADMDRIAASNRK